MVQGGGWCGEGVGTGRWFEQGGVGTGMSWYKEGVGTGRVGIRRGLVKGIRVVHKSKSSSNN